eukprot:669851-Pyramimonas_sp.AAC.1
MSSAMFQSSTQFFAGMAMCLMIWFVSTLHSHRLHSSVGQTKGIRCLMVRCVSALWPKIAPLVLLQVLTTDTRRQYGGSLVYDGELTIGMLTAYLFYT